MPRQVRTERRTGQFFVLLQAKPIEWVSVKSWHQEVQAGGRSGCIASAAGARSGAEGGRGAVTMNISYLAGSAMVPATGHGRSVPNWQRFSATALRNVEHEIETREELYPVATLEMTNSRM